jgi:hypothetical protein
MSMILIVIINLKLQSIWDMVSPVDTTYPLGSQILPRLARRTRRQTTNRVGADPSRIPSVTGVSGLLVSYPQLTLFELYV